MGCVMPNLESCVEEDIFVHIPQSFLRARDKEKKLSRQNQTIKVVDQQAELKDGIRQGEGEHEGDRDEDVNEKETEEVLRLVVMITGNPGLIGYYTPFLAELAKSLEESSHHQRPREQGRQEGKNRDLGLWVLFGASLGGFEADRSPTSTSPTRPPKPNAPFEDVDVQNLLFPSVTEGEVEGTESLPASAAAGPGRLWGLREQVTLCVARVDELVRLLRARHQRNAKLKVKVILIGHSVGTWIALDMIRENIARLEKRNKERQIKQGGTEHTPHSGKLELSPYAELEWMVEAAILLTPTIMDLHLSPNGLIASPLLGSFLGGFLPGLAQAAAQFLSWGLGEDRLRWLVGRVTGMEGEGLQTTIKFLTRKTGVRQALFLAGQELRIIRGDQWGGEVWGNVIERNRKVDVVGVEDMDSRDGMESRKKAEDSPRLFFLFAQNDHWVANETREEILKTRDTGNRTGKHRFVLDEDLEHAWCLKQSRKVAGRVKEWIEEIIDGES